MEKKRFNWIGWTSTIVYVLFAYVLIHIGEQYRETEMDYVFGLCTLGLVAIIILIPVTWIMSWRIILPIKKARVKLAHKSVHPYTVYVEGGGMQERQQFRFTFEFPDDSRIAFLVPVSVFNSFFENDSGILTYKDQGKVGFFINFERQG